MYPTFQFEPSINELSPNLETIVQTMGYTMTKIPDMYREMLMHTHIEARSIVTPKCGFVVQPEGSAQVESGKVILDGITFETKSIVSAPLKGIRQGVAFVATVGPEFDAWSKRTFESGDPLKGYMIDLLGSEFAECIADWIEAKIFDYAITEGFSISNRYSPGYCGWDVKEQHQLFKFFPENFCGISLTESALMRPHKSVSGIIGLGSDIQREEYPCDVCEVKHCYKNRHPGQ
jgi:hypothetical protein